MDRNENGLLKFITCGSVDDGKSTLIGTCCTMPNCSTPTKSGPWSLKVKSAAAAVPSTIRSSSTAHGRTGTGHHHRRRYRYFNTDNRSFIVADTPGHEEYTRNMAVGASFADLAIILIDATQGVLVQTRRHARICALMGIRYFIFAINKMDLVGYDQKRFEAIKKEIEALRDDLELENVVFIPVSATEGTTSPKSRNPWPGTMARPSSTTWKRSTSKKTTKKAFTFPFSASAVRTIPSAASRARSKAAL